MVRSPLVAPRAHDILGISKPFKAPKSRRAVVTGLKCEMMVDKIAAVNSLSQKPEAVVV
jgi:hypothetical protein